MDFSRTAKMRRKREEEKVPNFVIFFTAETAENAEKERFHINLSAFICVHHGFFTNREDAKEERVPNFGDFFLPQRPQRTQRRRGFISIYPLSFAFICGCFHPINSAPKLSPNLSFASLLSMWLLRNKASTPVLCR